MPSLVEPPCLFEPPFPQNGGSHAVPLGFSSGGATASSTVENPVPTGMNALQDLLYRSFTLRLSTERRSENNIVPSFFRTALACRTSRSRRIFFPHYIDRHFPTSNPSPPQATASNHESFILEPDRQQASAKWVSTSDGEGSTSTGNLSVRDLRQSGLRTSITSVARQRRNYRPREFQRKICSCKNQCTTLTEGQRKRTSRSRPTGDLRTEMPKQHSSFQVFLTSP